LFRFTDGNNVSQLKIFSNYLGILQSGSNFPGNEYEPKPTGNLLPACDPIYSIVATGDNGPASEEIKIDELAAMQLIHDSVNFYANPNVAAWLAEMRLYENLSSDSSTRENNFALNTFYETKKAEATGVIKYTNDAIHYVTNIECLTDSNNYKQALLLAKESNDDIVSSFVQEDNERVINEIYFKTLEYNYNLLSTTDKNTVENLAKSCPLLNGNAVYKARTIWQYFEPWVCYNNMQLCNTLSSNSKNSTGTSGPFSFVMDMLDSNALTNSVNTTLQIPFNNEFKNVEIEAKQLSFSNRFSVSPNPAQNQLTIQYKLPAEQDASLFIYNTKGQLIQQIFLPFNMQIVTTSIDDCKTGIYDYKIIVNNQCQQVGKLTVIK
jgi:hypothetical protein